MVAPTEIVLRRRGLGDRQRRLARLRPRARRPARGRRRDRRRARRHLPRSVRAGLPVRARAGPSGTSSRSATTPTARRPSPISAGSEATCPGCSRAAGLARHDRPLRRRHRARPRDDRAHASRPARGRARGGARQPPPALDLPALAPRADRARREQRARDRRDVRADDDRLPRRLFDTPDLTYFVPLAVGVLLLSFGTDYNLFVVGRIWQESRHRSVPAAVRAAVPRASRAISIAGLALAGSFATLAIVPIAPFREFAVAIAIGVVIDTFVVRTLLIPALFTTLGDRSWWPGQHVSPNPGFAGARRGTISSDGTERAEFSSRRG